MARPSKARTARRSVRIVRRRQGSPRPGRARDEGWRVGRVDMSDVPVGPDVITPTLEEVLRAIENVPRGDDWPAVSGMVIPVFPRVRPLPPGYPTPLRSLVPPGVLVGFGLDIGPAFMNVSPEQLEILGISERELVAQALTNLVARAEQVDPGAIVHESVDGEATVGLQTGLSIGSTLVLVPDQLRRIFGPDPRLFLAPMRDLLLGLPPDIDPDLAVMLFEDFASQDPNCLAPVAYHFDGRQVSTAAFGDAPRASRRLLA